MVNSKNSEEFMLSEIDEDKRFEGEVEYLNDLDNGDKYQEVYVLVQRLFENFEKESSQKSRKNIMSCFGNSPRKTIVL